MRALLGAAALAGVMVLALPLSASAADELMRTQDGAPLVFEELAPGSTRTGDLVVTNTSANDATFAFAVRVTSQQENGCLRQEAELEGDACDEAGELADWLDVTFSRDDEVLWSGPISALDAPQPLTGSLSAGESWDLQVDLTMPLAAGNDTMTDRIGFDLVAHATEVAGEQGTDPETGEGAGQPSDTEILGVEMTSGAETPASPESGTSVPTAVDAGLAALGLDALRDGDLTRLLTVTGFGLVALLAAGLAVAERRRRRDG